jgi:hypothetical protein
MAARTRHFRSRGRRSNSHISARRITRTTRTPRPISAQVQRPIIAPAARQPNTLGDRVMRCPSVASTRTTSPDMWRYSEPSALQI